MILNCGPSWGERRFVKHMERVEKYKHWHRKFVIKKRIGGKCYILDYVWRKREYWDGWSWWVYDHPE